MKLKYRALLCLLIISTFQLSAQSDTCLKVLENDLSLFERTTFAKTFHLSDIYEDCDLSLTFSRILDIVVYVYPNYASYTYYVGTARSRSEEELEEDKQNQLSYRDFIGYETEFLPHDMLIFYLISAIYYNDVSFKERVSLGLDSNQRIKPVERKYPKHNYPVRNKIFRQNDKILREVRRALRKWIVLLEERGIEELRAEGIHPLYFSKYKWL